MDNKLEDCLASLETIVANRKKGEDDLEQEVASNLALVRYRLGRLDFDEFKYALENVYMKTVTSQGSKRKKHVFLLK